MHARQHIPAFFTGPIPEEANVPSLAALLALEWVHRWTENPSFDRWSISRSALIADLLMAEMKDGSYWVVAFIYDAAEALDLPEWKPPKEIG